MRISAQDLSDANRDLDAMREIGVPGFCHAEFSSEGDQAEDTRQGGRRDMIQICRLASALSP